MKSFTMVKKMIEGELMWCVQRVDGKTINAEGVSSYNFKFEDRDYAYCCMYRLEKTIENK